MNDTFHTSPAAKTVGLHHFASDIVLFNNLKGNLNQIIMYCTEKSRVEQDDYRYLVRGR